MFQLELICVQRPAACQVEPLVSSFASTKVTSVHPSFVRWYKRLHPGTPPPITTTFVSVRMAPLRSGRQAK